MLSTGLPISRYVTVQVSLTSPAITTLAINTCLIVTSDDFIDHGERARAYDNISQVAYDAGVDSVAYAAADIYFSQAPRPDHVLIGRWVKDPAPASLLCAILPDLEQDIALWRAISDGSFRITIGGTSQNVTGLDFSEVTNLNGVASIIQTALHGAGPTPDTRNLVVWVGNRFVFRSPTTGVTATIGYLEPATPAIGTDISGPQRTVTVGTTTTTIPGLRGGVTTADRVVDGAAPETALSAVAAVDANFSSNFYGVVVPEAEDHDQLEIAAYIEASDPVHYLGVTTTDTNVLDPMHTYDLASELHDFGYNKTAIQFSSRTPYAILSYLGRILTTQWSGSNTVPTLMYKNQPGVHIEQISSYQADALQDKCCNVYTGVANGANITQYGFSSSGEWTDVIIGADALALDVQAGLFAAMYNTATKIPQTDPGVSILTTRASSVCARYVANGYLAPGVWNAPGFGTLTQGQLLPLGYFIWAPSMGDQDPNERAQRRAPIIQIAAKAAGAIHHADVLIFINQ